MKKPSFWSLLFTPRFVRIPSASGACRGLLAVAFALAGTQCAGPVASDSGGIGPRSDSLGGSQSRAAEMAYRRPGLGTEFGESRDSEVDSTHFLRSSSRPAAVGKIFYNDRQGVSAATGDRRSSSGWHEIADGLVSFGIKSEGGWQRAVNDAGHLYVIGEPGERYDILLKNETSRRVEAVVAVDGLDVLDGRPASYAKRGYVIPAHGSVRIEGWRVSMNRVAAFRFAKVAKSYAAEKYGDTRNVGVIGVAVFTSTSPKPWVADPHPTWRTGDIQRRESANPFPESSRFATPPPSRRDW
ncbi:MAG TPA: hypothetical protein VK956_04045 [Verrucomicrobium sp.]|nr:hypothetical protein [Verrucomicrobium sp.]